jgi:hypothetical protein
MQEGADTPMSLPAGIVLLSALFPFPPDSLPIEKLDDFVPHLPSYKTVIFLSELYYAHYGWWYVSIRHVHNPTIETATVRIQYLVLCLWLLW